MTEEAQDAPEIDLELLQSAYTRLKTLEQNERMVKYRKEKKLQLTTLRQVVKKLQKLHDDLVEMKAEKRRGILPWSQVAQALEEENALAEAQKSALESQVNQHADLLRTMKAWVRFHTRVERPLEGACTSWRNVTLFANAESRQLGKEWITKQIYHNMDRLYMEYGFPALHSNERISYDLQLRFADDGGYTAIYRRQYELGTTLEQSIAFFSSTMLELQCFIPQHQPDKPNIIEDIQPSTRQYALLTGGNEFANVLVGQFQTPDRFVFVLQQIQDDEAVQGSRQYRQRNRLAVYDMHRLPGGKTKYRILALISQMFTPDGFVSLDEDAREWGFSLESVPEHLKQLKFPHLWNEELKRQLAIRYQRFLAKQSPS